MAKEPAKKSRARRVKSPESFREKAAKAGSEKPKRNRLGVVSKTFRKITSAIKSPFKKAGNTRIGKILKKPFRIISVILLIPYFKGSFKELKLVSWPSFKQSRKLTYAVLAFAIVFGTAIAGLDWALGKIFKQILIK
ncbi:MAG TPA: preprotein translocase subunit SecE [Candidatus Saccharimonadales bacterium]|nr:preprotein translocase subunit SecE [Candidatus Saccharimonadales bacterium]